MAAAGLAAAQEPPTLEPATRVPIQPVAAQPRPAPAPPPGGAFRRDESPQGYRVPFELPGPERLFRLESEATMYQRMKEEARERRPPERISFPEEPTLSRTPYYGRDWPPQKMIAEPIYVCHERLLFEQLYQERYGWDFGILAPITDTLIFYKDLVLLPYHLGTQPLRCFECSSGKCQPGDPVPLLLEPPELSLTGAAAEVAVIATLLAVFP